jgi:hypothetical protein
MGSHPTWRSTIADRDQDVPRTLGYEVTEAANAAKRWMWAAKDALDAVRILSSAAACNVRLVAG